MPKPSRVLPALILAVVLGGESPRPANAADEAKPVSFSRQIVPVLQAKCQGCHQPAKSQGGLDLTSFASLKAGGKSGPGLVPHRADESELVEAIIGTPPTMPPSGATMTPSEVALVRQWVDQGGIDDTPPTALDVIDADHPPLYRAPPVTSALAYSPDGQFLASSGYREVLIHAADGEKLLHRLVGQAQRIETLTFSPDGGLLAAVGGSPGRFGEVQFWDMKTGRLRSALRIGYDTLYGGAFSPDGSRFALGCSDNSARILDVVAGKETLRVDQHSDWVFATAFSLDGKHLITLGRDGAVKLVEAGTGSFIDDLGKNYGELKTLARHPKLDQVVIGGDERIPRLYKIFRTQARDPNYTDFNLIKAFESQPGGPIAAVAFAPDGSIIAVGGASPEVHLYKTDDGARKVTMRGFRGAIFALAFAADGSRVAVGGFDGTVRIFDAASGQLVRGFVPVPLEVPGVARSGM